MLQALQNLRESNLKHVVARCRNDFEYVSGNGVAVAMSAADQETVSALPIRPTTMAVRLDHLGRMLPTPFKRTLEQIVR